MGLGFLTLGDSIDVVLCPGCPTLSDWCVVRSKDGGVQWFSRIFFSHFGNCVHKNENRTSEIVFHKNEVSPIKS